MTTADPAGKASIGASPPPKTNFETASESNLEPEPKGDSHTDRGPRPARGGSAARPDSGATTARRGDPSQQPLRATGSDPSYVHRLRPTFYQADPAGVLFYGRVFELFHQAYAGLIVEAGIHYERHFGIREYAIPIVHAEADYRSPIRPGDDLSVYVWLVQLGESSIIFEFEIRGDSGDIRATGREVHVTVDAKTFVKRPIPGDVRAALEPLLTGESGLSPSKPSKPSAS